MSRHAFRTPDGLDLDALRVLPRRPPRAALLLVHGFGEHTGSFAHVFGALAGVDRAVLGFDERGHGRSPGQRGHLASWRLYRDDLRGFVAQAQQGLPGVPVFLIGNSLGTIRVLDLALELPAPCAGLVLCSAPLGAVGASPRAMAAARLLSRFAPRLPIRPGLDLSNLSRDQARARQYAGDGLYHQRATARGAAEALRAIETLKERAPELRPPLLMLHGSDDAIARPDQAFFAAAGSADKERRVYPGARHNLFQETNRDEVVADIVAWVEARLPPA